MHTKFTYVDVLSVWQRLVMLYAYEEHPLLLLFDFVVLFFLLCPPSPPPPPSSSSLFLLLLLLRLPVYYYISFIYKMCGSEQRSSYVSSSMCVCVSGKRVWVCVRVCEFGTACTLVFVQIVIFACIVRFHWVWVYFEPFSISIWVFFYLLSFFLSCFLPSFDLFLLSFALCETSTFERVWAALARMCMTPTIQLHTQRKWIYLLFNDHRSQARAHTCSTETFICRLTMHGISFIYVDMWSTQWYQLFRILIVLCFGICTNTCAIS